MRILHTVEFYEPSKGGAQEVIRQISERLARRGHDVTVATSYHPDREASPRNGVSIRQFRIHGNAVKGITGEADAYQGFLLEGGFDVMMNYAAQTWATDLVFPILGELPMRTVIMPLGYSRLHHPKYHAYFRALPSYLGRYDRIAYTSLQYQDARFGVEHGLTDRAVIIPNGASEEEFTAVPLGFRTRIGVGNGPLFITVANHYFAKGHLDVIRAFRAAADRTASLAIIGERPPRHGWYSCAPICSAVSAADRRIHTVSGLSREWVVSAYLESDAFLFASKVECAPLVMYEAFASHTPFITTDVGNVSDHHDVITLVRGGSDMEAQIRRFINDPAPFVEKADEAYALFLRDHTWERLTDRFEALYADVVVSGDMSVR